MIAALSLTILLHCNEPMLAIAEVGRVTREYPIASIDFENKRIELEDPEDPHYRFLEGVTNEMAIRKIPIRFRNQLGDCA